MHAPAVRILTSAALAAALCTPLLGAAKAPSNPLSGYVVPDAVTHHTMRLHGRTLRYTARAGTIVLRDADQKPQATMFYTAYTLDGAKPSTRPLTFFYNGGPGSATLWLRMGSFGPVRVEVGNGQPTLPPPYHVIDNPQTLLDVSDLVFIDMPATGYGRILPGGNAKSIFGTDHDIADFAQFIERYITKFDRWNSPKVLYGESYGTPRSAMLVNYLQNEGVGINGVVLQSSILDDALATPEVYGGASTDDWQYIFEFPTEAATAWHYHAVPGAPKSLSAYMAQMTAFALGPYRDALDEGDTIPTADRDRMAAEIAHYTGLSEQYVKNSKLRVSADHYLAEFRRAQGQSLGMYDSRYNLFTLDRAEATPSQEATDNAITDAFTSINDAYISDDLHYRTNLLYQPDAGDAIGRAGGWDFTHDGNLPLDSAPDLAQAMVANPHLLVFSANGYYDSVTPFLATVYTLHHLGIAPQLSKNITYGFYPSGHMLYLNPTALAALRADLGRWYAQISR